MGTRKSLGRAVSTAILCGLVAATLVALRSTATAAVPGDPLCVAKPASTAASATKILVIGDSLTSASAGDYTWRYFLWKHLVNPTGAASPAPAAFDFVGPYTAMVQPVSPYARTSTEYNCDFDEDNGAIPGSSLTSYTAAESTGGLLPTQSTVIRNMAKKYAANVLVVFAGAQDLGASGVTADTVIDRMKTVVTEAQKANAAIKVVVVTAPDDGTVAKVADFNTKLVAQAPAWKTTKSSVAVAQTAKSWGVPGVSYDRIHPNPQGEVTIAADVADALASLGVGSAATRPLPDYSAYVGPHLPATLADPVVTGTTVTLTWTLPPGSTVSAVQRNDYTAGSGWQTFPSAVDVPAGAAGPPYKSTFADTTYVPGHVYQYRIVSAKSTTVWTSAGTGNPALLAPPYVQYSTRITSNAVTAPVGATLPASPTGTPTPTSPTTQTPEPPGAVSSFTATPSPHGMKLAWGSATGATAYRFTWEVVGSGNVFSKDVGASVHSYAMTGLAPGRAYNFRVQALSGSLPGPARAVRAVPKPYALAKPVKPVLKALSGHRVKVTWKAVTHAGKYQVQVRLVGGAWKSVGTTTARSFGTKALKKGKSYDVRVRAYDGSSAGPFSAASRVKVR